MFTKVGALIFGLLLFLFAFSWIWNGSFLPEPNYSASSFSGVITKEISLSIPRLLIDTVICLLSVYLILAFFEGTFFSTRGKHLMLTVLFSAIFSTIIISLQIYKSINYWQPFIALSQNFNDSTFGRGRGGAFGAQKEYALTAHPKSFNLSSIESQIIPSMSRSGYSVGGFFIRVNGKIYSSNQFPNSISVDDIRNVPFSDTLKPNEVINITFENKRAREGTNLIIDYSPTGELEVFMKTTLPG